MSISLRFIDKISVLEFVCIRDSLINDSINQSFITNQNILVSNCQKHSIESLARPTKGIIETTFSWIWLSQIYSVLTQDSYVPCIIVKITFIMRSDLLNKIMESKLFFFISERKIGQNLINIIWRSLLRMMKLFPFLGKFFNLMFTFNETE